MLVDATERQLLKIDMKYQGNTAEIQSTPIALLNRPSFLHVAYMDIQYVGIYKKVTDLYVVSKAANKYYCCLRTYYNIF